MLLDVQFVTDHLRQFGAIEIPATRYLQSLDDALRRPARFYSDPTGDSLGSALESLFSQSSTQTS
jgi:leucyl/phenylalanyl-tRNA--protein transferase